jgi:hypothetical protein
MDDYSQLDAPRPSAKNAREMAFASIVLGGVFAVMAPGMLVFEAIFTDARFRMNQSQLEKDITLIAAIGIGLAVMTTLTVSLVFAVRSFLGAGAEGQPRALPLAGCLLSGFSFVVWLGMSVNLFAIIGIIQ